MSKQIYGTSDDVGVAVSGTDTYYSKVIQARDGQAFSTHLQWTGTPTGTFTLWYSNKNAPDAADDDDWVQDTTWTPTNPAGSASKAFYNTSSLVALHVRFKYVNSGGSGTLVGWTEISKQG